MRRDIILSDLTDIDKVESITGFVRMTLPKKLASVIPLENTVATFFHVVKKSLIAITKTGECYSYCGDSKEWQSLEYDYRSHNFISLLVNKQLRPVTI